MLEWGGPVLCNVCSYQGGRGGLGVKAMIDCKAKAMKITSKAVGKRKRHPPYQQHCLTDFLIVYVCMCMCVCMYVCTYHWAPGRVAFRLKAAPVSIRIFILYSLSARSMKIAINKHTYVHVVQKPNYKLCL